MQKEALLRPQAMGRNLPPCKCGEQERGHGNEPQQHELPHLYQSMPKPFALNHSSRVSSPALSNRAGVARGTGAALRCWLRLGEGRLLPRSPQRTTDNNLKDNLKDNLRDNTFSLSAFTPLPINPLLSLLELLPSQFFLSEEDFTKSHGPFPMSVYKRFISRAIWPKHSLVSFPRPQTQQNSSPKSSLPRAYSFPRYHQITLMKSMSLYKKY